MNIFRDCINDIASKIEKFPQFIHVVIGPRQVGKSTGARQLHQKLPYPVHEVSADAPHQHSAPWIEAQWQSALRLVERDSQGRVQKPALLVTDEIQKVPL